MQVNCYETWLLQQVVEVLTHMSYIHVEHKHRYLTSTNQRYWMFFGWLKETTTITFDNLSFYWHSSSQINGITMPYWYPLCKYQLPSIAHYKITTLLLVELNHTPFSLMQLITSLWHLSDFTALQPETRHICSEIAQVSTHCSGIAQVSTHLLWNSPSIDNTIRIVLSTHQWIECSHTS